MEASKAIADFIEGIKPHSSADELNVLFYDLPVYFDEMHLPLLKLLAEKSGSLKPRLAQEILSLYRTVNSQDGSSPLASTKVKSRTELFLKALATEPKKPTEIYNFVSGLSSSDGESPLIDAILNGRKIKDIEAYSQFRLNHSDLLPSVLNEITAQYLSNSEIPSLPDVRLLGFTGYVNRHITSIPTLDEKIRFLSTIGNLEVLCNSDSKLNQKSFSNPAEDWRVEAALSVAGKNPGLAYYITHATMEGKSSAEAIEAHKLIYSQGLIPTAPLVKRLVKAKDKAKELERWAEARAKISAENFTPKDSLMQNLEYTNYYFSALKLGEPTDYHSYLQTFGRNKNG